MDTGGGEDCIDRNLLYAKHFGPIFHALLKLHLLSSIAGPVIIKLKPFNLIECW